LPTARLVRVLRACRGRRGVPVGGAPCACGPV